MFEFDSGTIVPLFIFAIPIVAITGGIVLAIVQTLSRHRMIELAQRERIAAIEHGVDPAKLPPISLGPDHDAAEFVDPHRRPIRRAQGLLIGGLVTLFTGVGLALFLGLINPDSGQPVWAVGLIPSFVGAALLISAAIVWPRKTGGAPPA